MTMQFCAATVIYQVGGGLGVTGYNQATALTDATTFWTGKTIGWIPLGNSLNEGPITSGTAAPLDFVGNSSNPGLYCANQDGYVFFRMRVYEPTFSPLGPTFPQGSYMLVIDENRDGTVDYGFAWDTQSRDNTKHGLEMTKLHSGGTPTDTWSATDFQDLDEKFGAAGSSSTKGAVDINGFVSGTTYRTTDGYVRTEDGQSVVNTQATTFIDFAVSWSYLSSIDTTTGLASNPNWNITAASINNSNDHGFLSADVMGAAPTSTIASSAGAWSAVPEPTTALAGLLLGAGLLRRRRN
jgi:hypothetical protein